MLLLQYGDTYCPWPKQASNKIADDSIIALASKVDCIKIPTLRAGSNESFTQSLLDNDCERAERNKSE
eukprot:1161997-Pelagomonas_calceolata.AAC.6